MTSDSCRAPKFSGDVGEPIYVYGYPGDVGGANTELWHTVKLWRSAGWPVRLFPAGDAASEWRRRLNGIGAETVDAIPAGSLVVGFCNVAFRREAIRLRRFLGCRLVNLPCMAWLPAEESRELLFDRYVFQSAYQYKIWMMRLVALGLPTGHAAIIHGAFDATELLCEPKPHWPNEPFAIGRLSRAYGQPGNHPALDKFPADYWGQCQTIRERVLESSGCELRVRVMGWSPEIEQYCGRPPAWAEVLFEKSESPQGFLSRIHCLVPGVGCCRENWPRVGLEAMAAGVPIVAERTGGWPELGPASLVATREEQASAVAAWAKDEPSRIEAVDVQRDRLRQICNSAAILEAWCRLFAGLREQQRQGNVA